MDDEQTQRFRMRMWRAAAKRFGAGGDGCDGAHAAILPFVRFAFRDRILELREERRTARRERAAARARAAVAAAARHRRENLLWAPVALGLGAAVVGALGAIAAVARVVDAVRGRAAPPTRSPSRASRPTGSAPSSRP